MRKSKMEIVKNSQQAVLMLLKNLKMDSLDYLIDFCPVTFFLIQGIYKFCQGVKKVLVIVLKNDEFFEKIGHWWHKKSINTAK